MFRFHLLLLTLLEFRHEILTLYKMQSIDNKQPDILVFAEKGSKTAYSKIKLYCVHTCKNKQVREHLLDKVVFVISNLPFSRLRPQRLPQIMLIVYVPHFLIELTHAKAALDVDNDCTKLLALVNFDRFLKHRLA